MGFHVPRSAFLVKYLRAMTPMKMVVSSDVSLPPPQRSGFRLQSIQLGVFFHPISILYHLLRQILLSGCNSDAY